MLTDVIEIQDSRIIVPRRLPRRDAINTEANGPIFEIDTYGIVGDLCDIIPRLIEVAQGRTTVAS